MSEWKGDLDDDCTLERYGYTAHVECMDDYVWWFAIYKNNETIYNSADMQTVIPLNYGNIARTVAEHCIEMAASRAEDKR